MTRAYLLNKKKICYRNTKKPAQTDERKQTATLQRCGEEGMKDVVL